MNHHIDPDLKRIPPYNLDAEMVTLGAILLRNDSISEIDGLLIASDFYTEAHQVIFKNATEIIKSQKPCDIVILTSLLKDRKLLDKCGGMAYIASLSDNVPSTANVASYAKIVRDKAIRRSLIGTASQIMDASYGDGEIKQILADAQEAFGQNGHGIQAEDIAIDDNIILESEAYQRIEMPAKRSIMHPIIQEQQIGLISSWRGVGKSWVGISLLDAITRGVSFGPWKTEMPVPCLYLDGEMAASDPKERLQMISRGEERKAPFYIYSDHWANINGRPRANLLNEQWRAGMKRALLERNVKLWIADNLGALAPNIDENIKKDFDPINHWLLDLRFSGVSTMMIHHVNKEGEQRGTSAREDNLDWSIVLKRPKAYIASDGADFVMEFTKSRVRHTELSLVQPVRFTLAADEDGRLCWKWSYMKADVRDAALEMIDAGELKFRDIAEALGVSLGTISNIKSKAIADGIMDKNGRLK